MVSEEAPHRGASFFASLFGNLGAVFRRLFFVPVQAHRSSALISFL
jgi:hypothetical protein